MSDKTMWLPSHADHGKNTVIAGVDTSRPVIDRCVVPVGGGRVCGTPFFEGEERKRERHFIDCCARNREHIEVARQQAHPDIMKPWDPEFFKWVRGNARALLEGRKRA